eukprot:Pgem_evm1s6611
MYTIFGGDKVIVTGADPKPAPQSILIEGKVRNDLYVIPSSIVQTNHPINTIDISKPPTIHDPNDIEQSIPCENITCLIEYAIRKNENMWENGLPDSSVVKSKLPERVSRGFDSRSVIHFPTHVKM